MSNIISNILSDLKDIELELQPLTTKSLVSLQPASLMDNRGDADRLRDSLAATGLAITIPLPLLQDVSNKYRKAVAMDECQATATIGDFNGCLRLIDIELGNQTHNHFGLAIDIGTTTVVVYLVDMSDGQVLSTASDYNGQVSHGVDILTRIQHADTSSGLAQLKQAVLTTLNSLIAGVVQEQGLALTQLSATVIAGNTTMIHLLLGLDPHSICREPYIPIVNNPGTLTAGELGLAINSLGPVYILPSIGSYVGGDVIAGILVSGMHNSTEISLLVDIGTNGEMILGNSEWLVACAGAAGPALEGGVVNHGMRAEPGAIEKVVIDNQTQRATCKIIGPAGTKPQGLCGSGLVDCIAQLLLTGIIDRRGVFRDEREHYELVPPTASATGEAIIISQKDIKNLLRTKGAVNASLEVLMAGVGCSLDELTSFYAAGAFGNYLDPESAVTIGLFPDLPREQLIPIGNSAGAGARLVLLSNEKRQEAEDIAKKVTYFEMNANQDFMHRFSAGLFLPHSNLDAYPTIKAKLIELDLIKTYS